MLKISLFDKEEQPHKRKVWWWQHDENIKHLKIQLNNGRKNLHAGLNLLSHKIKLKKKNF